jgi:multidrug efflux pump subunit AcrA (membrane-fusion protein)
MTETTNNPGDGQAPDTTNQGDSGQAPDSTPTTVSQADYDALSAKFDKAMNEIGKLRTEAGDRRVAAKTAEAEKLAALEAKGEYEEASKMKDAKIAELEALQAPAERWASFEAKQKEQVEEALKADDLPDYIRTAVGATADPLAQMSILQGYRAHGAADTPAPTKPPAGGGGGGGGSGDGPLDFTTMDDATKRQAIQDHPDKWRAHLEKMNGKRRRLSV